MRGWEMEKVRGKGERHKEYPAGKKLRTPETNQTQTKPIQTEPNTKIGYSI